MLLFQRIGQKGMRDDEDAGHVAELSSGATAMCRMQAQILKLDVALFAQESGSLRVSLNVNDERRSASGYHPPPPFPSFFAPLPFDNATAASHRRPCVICRRRRRRNGSARCSLAHTCVGRRGSRCPVPSQGMMRGPDALLAVLYRHGPFHPMLV